MLLPENTEVLPGSQVGTGDAGVRGIGEKLIVNDK
jgi:hypothetical protein